MLSRGINTVYRSIFTIGSRFTSSSNNYESKALSKKLTESYYYNDMSVPLVYRSLGQHLDKLAKDMPNHLCYTFKAEGNKKYTYRSFSDEVNSLATSLINLGFEKNDRIGVWLPNTSENCVITYAASKAGLIKVNINPAYMDRELSYCLNTVGCKGLLMRPNVKSIDCLKVIEKLGLEFDQNTKTINCESAPSLKHIILASNDIHRNPVGFHSYADLIRQGANSRQTSLEELQSTIDGDTPVEIYYTSGTTGKPKATTLTNFGLLNSCALPLRFTHPHIFERLCCPVPMFHIFGGLGGVLNINSAGYSTVFPAILPDPLETMRSIQEEKATVLLGAPIIYRDILLHPRRKEFDLSSLRVGIIGATAVNPSFMEQLEREIPIGMMSQAFGQTENTGLLTLSIFAGDDKMRRYLSVGKAMPHLEVKIVDKNNRVVPIGEEGEIYARGFNIMKGYYNDEKRTRETVLSTGWLRTGDIGTMDEDGFLYYRSRQKEMIIVGGINVYPVEIENVLLEHEDILEAQVFGIPDERYGEVACAWIRAKPGKTIDDLDTIRKFLSSRLAFFKVPKYYKLIDSLLPFTTPTGKVQKFKLAETMIEMMKKTS